MAGIDNSLASIAALQSLVLDLFKLLKDGVTLGSLPQIFKVLGDIKDLAADAPSALPELQDLDASEVGQLSAAAYVAVKAMWDAISPSITPAA